MAGQVLDQAEAAARLRDDEQAPEERLAVGRVRDSHVERLLEDDALRDVDEQAVLPLSCVLRRELLVRADELTELRVRLVEELEANPVRRTLDLDPPPSTVASPDTSISNIVLGPDPWTWPFWTKASGSKPLRSVKRHDSSVVVGIGSAR